MKKKILGVVLICLSLSSLVGCEVTVSGPSSELESYKTIDGKTVGYASKTTSDKGSASFNIQDNKIELTNIKFDAVGDTQCDIVENPLVFTNCRTLDKNGNPIKVIDGEYIENFTLDDSQKQFNSLYQKVFKAKDEPFIDNISNMQDAFNDKGLLGYTLKLNDGVALIMTKLNTNKYVIIGISEQSDIDYFTYLCNTLEADLGDTSVDLGSNDIEKDDNNVSDELKGVEPDKEVSIMESDIPEKKKQSGDISPDDIEISQYIDEKGDYGAAYIIKVDGVPISLDNFDGWKVVQSDERMISVFPSTDTAIHYSDSYIKVNDTDSVKREYESIQKSYNVEPMFYKYESEYGTDYLLTWCDGKENKAEYLQVLPNVGTYMKTDVYCSDLSLDILELVDLFAIVF